MGEFMFGFILGIFLAFGVIGSALNDSDGNKLKKECEQDLARDQKCIMMYVKPYKKGENNVHTKAL
jgi:hypothetical protein